MTNVSEFKENSTPDDKQAISCRNRAPSVPSYTTPSCSEPQHMKNNPQRWTRNFQEDHVKYKLDAFNPSFLLLKQDQVQDLRKDGLEFGLCFQCKSRFGVLPLHSWLLWWKIPLKCWTLKSWIGQTDLSFRGNWTFYTPSYREEKNITNLSSNHKITCYLFILNDARIRALSDKHTVPAQTFHLLIYS